ncbi:MAG: DUF1566 domain-containing protein, partial [Gammaproteobacteria bacterium]|nr:DUF1566 domain-containing protein [Gammaproteobacteria bacterium]
MNAISTALIRAMTVLLLGSGAAQAALIDRGGGFIYDDVLNVTWTRSASINGLADWATSVAWADALTIPDPVRGVNWSDWRLASSDVNGDDTVVNCASATEPDCRDNELGYLFHQYGIRSGAPGPFTDVQSSIYWTGTEFRPNLSAAWSFFFFGGGFQGGNAKTDDNYAWAVR